MDQTIHAQTGNALEHEDSPIRQLVVAVLKQLRPALLSVPLLTLLTGVVFPLVLAALAWPLFPHQAGGSLIVPGWGRRLRADRPGVHRAGLLPPASLGGRPRLRRVRLPAARISARPTRSSATAPRTIPPRRDVDESFAGVRELAEGYRTRNGLARDAVVPVDAVTRSGSGLDPHISPANAALQVARVARARGLSEAEVRRLVAEQTRGRQFGILGEPRVAVLPLNLALDRARCRRHRPRRPVDRCPRS